MNIAEKPAETKSLYIQRLFDCDCETMFNVWTDANVLSQWFGPEGVVTESAEVDLRPGGDYRFTLKLPDGEIVQHYGTYREIIAPEKLVFTWLLDGQVCEGGQAETSETLVSVEFRPRGKQTEVSLTHELFVTDKTKDMHAYGWNGCLDSLHRLLS